ncbi:hypothetical protein VDG1235_2588 [Verrucomicrobiia bacterium DG1235]|nr:hypothetical protein VDG1235_2588 [Verrucomicrobiae bacterium DG1235]
MKTPLFREIRLGCIAGFRIILALGFALCASLASAADSYVSSQAGQGLFPLVEKGEAAALYVDSADFSGVLEVAGHLQSDIERVSGSEPQLITDGVASGKAVVLIGTIGRSATIDRLAREGKIDAGKVSGRWDTFALQTVENPLPGVDQALVIFGSDKRGTIFGIYDLAAKIGVSPWHWWADAPVQTKAELFVQPGFHSPGEPKVKYRGIFINDEAPALTNWAEETFGGFNHQFYEKVYELILRNKGNYLWPAMWVPAAFYEDDAENARLADELGVVIATTHHEPMGRAHDEWSRGNAGPWNYETNGERLREFWRGGIERLGDYESVVTVGMRGDGDEAMTEDTAIDLMRTIVADQRKIIADVTGKPAEETPQAWALYKEMQDYYDKGMRVPDDVMVLLCDDNWGNIRILPKKEDLGREGGFGVYYHFDFVGGPVSYRWLNVTQIERTWEQMKLSYDWGARELWLVNVGDIKPMELPTSFFLDFAWNPEAMSAADLPQYYTDWAGQQFGAEHAKEIGEVLSLHTKYSARRTPEMIAPETYSVLNYREADTVLGEYRDLLVQAKRIQKLLPEASQAAYYQLVLYPVEASCNLNEMHVAAAKNKLFGEQGRASANHYAELTKKHFEKDAELTRYYHHEMADGKWNHMMSQTHIGYTHWNNPPVNKMPAVSYVHPTEAAGLGYALEDGPPQVHTQGGARYSNTLPVFDSINDQEYYIDLFNTGVGSVDWKLKAQEDWIVLSKTAGTVELEERVLVRIDWDKAPQDAASGKVVISGPKRSHAIRVPIHNEALPAKGFVENGGVVSIEAVKFDKASDSSEASWLVVPNLGRTASAVTVEPSNAARQTPGKGAPQLEYVFTVFGETEFAVDTYLSPTLNYQKNEGLKYAIAIDDEAPQIINIHQGETAPDWEYPEWWNNSVTDHIKIKRSQHTVAKPGVHTLKIWMVDPGVVFQKFVIDTGGLKPSYLGPPESKYLD